MKNLLSLFILSFVLLSCDALHRGIPKAPRHHTVVAKEAKDLTLEVAEISQSETESSSSSIETENTLANSSELISFASIDSRELQHIPALVNEDTLNTVEVSEEENAEMIRQAKKSELIATTASVFSIVTIVGVFFFPLLLIGLIGSLVCFALFKQLQFVSEKAEEKIKRAKRRLKILGIVYLCLLLLVVGIILLALFLIL